MEIVVLRVFSFYYLVYTLNQVCQCVYMAHEKEGWYPVPLVSKVVMCVHFTDN